MNYALFFLNSDTKTDIYWAPFSLLHQFRKNSTLFNNQQSRNEWRIKNMDKKNDRLAFRYFFFFSKKKIQSVTHRSGAIKIKIMVVIIYSHGEDTWINWPLHATDGCVCVWILFDEGEGFWRMFFLVKSFEKLMANI